MLAQDGVQSLTRYTLADTRTRAPPRAALKAVHVISAEELTVGIASVEGAQQAPLARADGARDQRNLLSELWVEAHSGLDGLLVGWHRLNRVHLVPKLGEQEAIPSNVRANIDEHSITSRCHAVCQAHHLVGMANFPETIAFDARRDKVRRPRGHRKGSQRRRGVDHVGCIAGASYQIRKRMAGS